jgi:hypothetical protein
MPPICQLYPADLPIFSRRSAARFRPHQRWPASDSSLPRRRSSDSGTYARGAVHLPPTSGFRSARVRALPRPACPSPRSKTQRSIRRASLTTPGGSSDCAPMTSTPRSTPSRLKSRITYPSARRRCQKRQRLRPRSIIRFSQHSPGAMSVRRMYAASTVASKVTSSSIAQVDHAVPEAGSTAIRRSAVTSPAGDCRRSRSPAPITPRSSLLLVRHRPRHGYDVNQLLQADVVGRVDGEEGRRSAMAVAAIIRSGIRRPGLRPTPTTAAVTRLIHHLSHNHPLVSAQGNDAEERAGRVILGRRSKPPPSRRWRWRPGRSPSGRTGWPARAEPWDDEGGFGAVDA